MMIKSNSVAHHTDIKTNPLAKVVRYLPWILIMCGVIGLLASTIITQEKLDLAQNASYQPACDLNPIISCGSVMKSPQAHVFGFPNSYIGMIGFPIVVAVGMGMLAGAKFKRWFWLGMQTGLILGMAFAYWLLFESVYRIRALCPYCLTVDIVITIAFWYVTLYNFREGFLRLPSRLKSVGAFVKAHHVDILVLWFIIIIALILKHFWYYFGRYF